MRLRLSQLQLGLAWAELGNMGLKHRILPNDNFKTHFFFFNFWVGDPSELGSWSERCVKPLELSREAI